MTRGRLPLGAREDVGAFDRPRGGAGVPVLGRAHRPEPGHAGSPPCARPSCAHAAARRSASSWRPARGHRHRRGRPTSAQSGIQLAIWEPVNDHSLLFQINRALRLASSALTGNSLRGDQRIPTGWMTRYYISGRARRGGLYSLSAGGAYLCTPRPSVRGAEIALDLPLPAWPDQPALPRRLHERPRQPSAPPSPGRHGRPLRRYTRGRSTRHRADGARSLGPVRRLRPVTSRRPKSGATSSFRLPFVRVPHSGPERTAGSPLKNPRRARCRISL